jgi:hypothetical protein
MPARVATALGYESRQAFLDAYREQTTAVRDAYEQSVGLTADRNPGSTANRNPGLTADQNPASPADRNPGSTADRNPGSNADRNPGLTAERSRVAPYSGHPRSKPGSRTPLQ